MLALAEEIDGVRIRVRAPIDFVATTGEEGAGDLRGAKAFFAGAAGQIAAAIALDGAGDERVVHRALGARRFRVTYRGPEPQLGRVWRCQSGHAAAAAVATLGALSLPREPRTHFDRGPDRGGIAVNAIPECGWFEVDLRSASAVYSSATIATSGQRRMPPSSRERPPCSGHSRPHRRDRIIGDRPCGDVPADDPLVVAGSKPHGSSAAKPTWPPPPPMPMCRSASASPAVAIGAGGTAVTRHTVSEWYDNAEGTLDSREP